MPQIHTNFLNIQKREVNEYANNVRLESNYKKKHYNVVGNDGHLNLDSMFWA